jgi:hypothetical protein
LERGSNRESLMQKVLVTALEKGLGNVIDNEGSSGAYPYGAGIRWDVNVTNAFLGYAQSWTDWLIEKGPVARPTEFSTKSYLPVPT